MEPQAAGEGGAFWRALRDMFPPRAAADLEKAVAATLCKSGVVPEGWTGSRHKLPWKAAWAGERAFVLRARP